MPQSILTPKQSMSPVTADAKPIEAPTARSRRWFGSVFAAACIGSATLAYAPAMAFSQLHDESGNAPTPKPLNHDAAEPPLDERLFRQNQIIEAANAFFGTSSEALTRALADVFNQNGAADAYIAGDEISGAVGAGARFGRGLFHYRDGSGLDASEKIYWKGPSIGADYGGNISKVFFLIYRLDKNEDMFQRFVGIQGGIYVVGGLSVDTHKHNNTLVVSVRTGVGMRSGGNLSYVRFTRDSSWLPF